MVVEYSGPYTYLFFCFIILQVPSQILLENEHEGATIVPVIISTDKTQLTLFRNKTAYPIYLTIGNIPKGIRCKPSRHAQILLEYLPSTRLLQITSDASRRRTLANLFHTYMRFVLAPLKAAGVGPVMASSAVATQSSLHLLVIIPSNFLNRV